MRPSSKDTLKRAYIPYVCEVCSKNRFGTTPKQFMCNPCKKQLAVYKKQIGWNYYVYAWFYPGQSLPYYVGMGQKMRAYRGGPDKRGRRITCILVRGLTRPAACELERAVVNAYRELGANLSVRGRGLW